jgi:hypothetical protein
MLKSNLLLFFCFLLTSINAQNFQIDTTFNLPQGRLEIKSRTLNNELIIISSKFNSNFIEIDSIDLTGLAYIKYPDFNSDKYPDILLDYIGNNSSYSLYLFDSIQLKYKKIRNYSDFPDAIKIKPNLYYSYQAVGCADLNWVSDLFKIENFEIVHLAHMEAESCENDSKTKQKTIQVFKVKDSVNNQRFHNFNYNDQIKKNDDKWNYLKKYWSNNFSFFL